MIEKALGVRLLLCWLLSWLRLRAVSIWVYDTRDPKAERTMDVQASWTSLRLVNVQVDKKMNFKLSLKFMDFKIERKSTWMLFSPTIMIDHHQVLPHQHRNLWCHIPRLRRVDFQVFMSSTTLTLPHHHKCLVCYFKSLSSYCSPFGLPIHLAMTTIVTACHRPCNFWCYIPRLQVD